MKYRAVVGLNYPDPQRPGEEIRVEAGDVMDYVPVPWLLEQGHVVPVDDVGVMTGSPVAAASAGDPVADEEER